MTQFRSGNAVAREPAARAVTKGHVRIQTRYEGTPMNPNSRNPNSRRRNGLRRPQTARRPQNGVGNARQHYERYLARARDAQLSGDAVEMENCYQHAEHYFRAMKEQAN
jgi:hypothetical protein